MLAKKHNLLISVHKILFLRHTDSQVIQKTHGVMALLVLHLNLFGASPSHPEQPMMVAWLELHERQRPKISPRNVWHSHAKSEVHREGSLLQPVSESIKLQDQFKKSWASQDNSSGGGNRIQQSLLLTFGNQFGIFRLSGKRWATAAALGSFPVPRDPEHQGTPFGASAQSCPASLGEDCARKEDAEQGEE